MSSLSPRTLTRREILALTSRAALAGALLPNLSFGANESSTNSFGAIVGDKVGAKVGEKILRDGGNAIDAAIGAAFAACIASPSMCGIGGYGGHAMIALAGGKKVTAIDFNSVAPAAARADMFPLDESGRVKGGINTTGWLAAGVPGTVAGLELALQRYGTRSLRDTLAPAIQLCEGGTHVAAVKGIDDTPRNDPKADLDQAGGLPPAKKRNLALAALLKTFATRNTADSFYRGDIAGKIADCFKRNGGLVTREDLAAYHAREVVPLALEWNGATVHTAPLTAAGLLFLDAFSTLKVLNWPAMDRPQQLHAKLEALRIAWSDRQLNFGDPEFVKVPVEKLLSSTHATACAEKVLAALKTRKPVALDVDPSRAGGTTHISAVDRHGNMIAITLTHGGSYGARVAVPEFGVVLGHGMSRFDPRPGLPNSPGPRKRPINNMCPTIVTRAGVPVLAVGAAGGTRIPNSVYEVLLNHVALGAPMETAMASPRLDSNGTLKLGLEKKYSDDDEAFFKSLGYATSRGPSANVSAVSFDPKSREARGLSNVHA